MTAKKNKLEDLDYIKIKENRCYILYKHKRCNCYIEFTSNLSGSIKQISCYSKGLIFKHEIYLSLEELQAINKQCEELGWYE